MANLIKSSNGLLFYDDFSEKTLMWTLSPSDANCLSFGDNGLQLKHNRRYCSYTITEPAVEEYSCIVKIDHIPLSFDDIAGILVLSTNKEYAECQTYLATGSSELTNSTQLEDSIQNMVNIAIDNANYVKYSVDGQDEESDDIDESEPMAVSDNDDSELDDSSTTGGFVDTIYKYIKINKTKYKYVFYASADSYSWIEVGNVRFTDSGVLGFFIYGTDDTELIENSHCYINDFAFYSSKYLNITGVSRSYDMELIDDAAHKVLLRTDSVEYQHMINRSNKECLINTTMLPMPLENVRLRVYDKNNYETTEFEFSLDKTYGGDTYTLEKDIRCYIDNTEIDPEQLYDLGTFYHGAYYIKMDVHNHEEYILNDVRVKVIKYSEYYGGEEAVGIALYNEDQLESELVYQKQVVIDEIKPSEGRSVFIKLTDKPFQDFYNTANSYRFKIIIE